MEENPYKAPVDGSNVVDETSSRTIKVLALIVGLLFGVSVGAIIVVAMLRAVWNAQRIVL